MLCPYTQITCGIFRVGEGGEVRKEKSSELLVLCLFSKSSGQQQRDGFPFLCPPSQVVAIGVKLRVIKRAFLIGGFAVEKSRVNN